MALKKKLMDNMEKMLEKSPESGCQSCSLEFANYRAMYRHMWSMHQEKNVECELCHNTYGRRKHMIEHYNRVHFITKKRRENISPKRSEQEPTVKKEASNINNEEELILG